MKRLLDRRPVVIISADLDDSGAAENQRRLKSLAQSALDAGFGVMVLTGRWQDVDRIWSQSFLAVFGVQNNGALLQEWAIRWRQQCGQELVIVKAHNVTALLFDSGRTEIWPDFGLGMVVKAYERSRGRGRLAFEEAFKISEVAECAKTVPKSQP